jgi:hypothetical protein
VKKKLIFFFLRLFVTSGLLIILFKFIPYQKLLQIYKDSRKEYIFLGLLIFFISLNIGILRWKYILFCLGVRLPLKEAFYSFFCGLFFNLFFPSFIAQDLFRGFSIVYRYKELEKVTASLFMDRYSGTIALSFLSFFSLFLKPKLIYRREVIIPVMFIFSATLFVYLSIFNKRIFKLFLNLFKKNSSLVEKIKKFHHQFYFFKKNPYLFLKIMIFSFLTQILTCFSFFIISKAFYLDLNLIYFFILVPVVTVISLIPITIAGLGTREAASVYFFSFLGVEKSIALGISLVNFFFWVFTAFLGGIIYVSVYYRRFQPHP